MANKKLTKGEIKKPFKFLVTLFSVLFLVSGFTFFIDGISAAKLGKTPSKFQGNLTTLDQEKVISDDGLWQKIDRTNLNNIQSPAINIQPDKFHLVELNKNVLKQILASAPLENSELAASTRQVMSLPMPDGSFGRFTIVESPMMESGLAAEFPEIKTYSGYGIDDPTAYVRFDVTSAGFHAMIRSANGLVLIDPQTTNNTDAYISYSRSDVNSIRQAKCLVKGDGLDISKVAENDGFTNFENKSLSNQDRDNFNLSVGPTLRTYRLAVGATAEFTIFHGGTVTAGMNAIVTIMNRVNGVYEQDLGIRMVLVNNNSQLVFTNSATDGYSNNDGFALLSQNQTKVDSVIGPANYDIGHVFSTGGGGVAGLGVVCFGGQKARGVTGLPDPIGDPFAIDFVAHEMGHQFGANHTFNGTTSSCGGGNRNSSTAYEPGSGTTIMAYAGICGSENLQNNSDPYFHGASFDEIVNFVTNSGTCGVQSATNNGAPVVDAGPNFTIPQGTPFTLTPTSASDPNGDALTYCWEQFNLGSASPPNTDNGNRPIFRSFNPTTSSSRTFPRLTNILNNNTTLGESLPTTNRTLNFRVTVRDNRANGGGVNNDSMQVTVNASAGPFTVTQPTSNTATGGGTLNVTWNVANTNAAPVNTSNVRISLSTDGGNTFPTILADNTPNDGSQTVTLPNVQTSNARIKVEAVGNIFFDISNPSFTINAGGGPVCTFTIDPTNASFTSTGGTGNITVTASDPSCARTATSNAAFITVTSGASGTGSGTVSYTVATNSSTSSRTGTITVAGQTFTVNQAGAPGCTFTLNPTSASFATRGGSGSITVTASSSTCARTATSNAAFITITSGASGTGNGIVAYRVAVNNGAARTGTITVGDQTFTINQAGTGGGGTPNCTFTINPTNASFTSTGGTGNIAVTASDPSCARTATSNAAFITVTSGASGTGSGTVSYTVATNSSTS
ncbi:MAG: hypothetical protein J0M03_21025, partial [Acidobacteria bacterium]|nr:hypothetical protein [Acidobacteriota bacterium]